MEEEQGNSQAVVPPESTPREEPQPSVDEQVPICSHCAREFPSWKSLFGHMRTHPHRDRRRVFPPPLSHSTQTASPLPPPNLMASLPGWSVTAKRGRCNLANANCDCPLADHDQHKMQEAVDGLLQLVQREEKPAADGQPKQTASYTSDHGITQRAKKKRRLDGKSGDQPRSFECDLCSKSFLSPQALGGHKAGHNYKFRKHSTRESDSGSSTCLASGDTNAAGEHVCNVCCLGFPTGQALGGHKRRHWTRPPQAPSPLRSSGKLLDFDLNELPPLQNDQPLPMPSSSLPVRNSVATSTDEFICGREYCCL